MVSVEFENKHYGVPSGISLLDALQDAGAKIPASCRSGVCQSCLMQSVDAPPPPHSQKELSPEKRKQGYFLACQCLPSQPMKVRLADEAIPNFEARVVGIKDLAPGIRRIRFARPENFSFQAGQYVNFHLGDGLVRSYSLASLPKELSFIDIHVRHLPGGQMSSWFFTKCNLGNSLQMTAPRGTCCYYSDSEDIPYLLVGIGTGVAPLQAIAREAILNGKSSPLYFYQGALNPERLYYRDELRNVARQIPTFHYEEIVLNGPLGEWRNGHVTDVLMQDFERLKQCQVYLCGDAGMVATIRKKLFIAGIPMKRIQADAFVSAPPPKQRNTHELR
jgi:CDP-4-dehydro-6-deoxyglucose reductase